MSEEQVTFDGACERLLGMLHRPDGETTSAYVFCNAFGDERKCSHRMLALLAREMARRGAAVLRFDYGGCGDSGGELREATIGSFEEDIACALEFAGQSTDAPHLGLLGLRLGGALAARVAAVRDDVTSLVLLQPILDGKAAFAADLKRKMVREMMMRGKSGGKRSDLVQQLEAGEGEIDLDGFVITGALYQGLMGINVPEQISGLSGRVLVVQIAPSDSIRPETDSLRSACEAAGAETAVQAVVEPPFWNRIEFMECSDTIANVCDWLSG